MANNRMFLACPCGEQFMIAKCLADNWYTPPFLDGVLEPRLNAWFDAHRDCEPRVWGGTIMALEYEQNKDTPGTTRRPARSAAEVAAEWRPRP